GESIEVAPAVEILDLVPGFGIAAEIARPDRRFAVAAGNIQHISRLAQSGIAAMQGAQERLAALDAGAPMRGPRRKIAVMQVVRLDPAFDEGAHQTPEHLCVIVDA